MQRQKGYCGYYNHADCELRGGNGICKALKDTWFGNNRDCPFYKRPERRKKDHEENMVPAAGRRL